MTVSMFYNWIYDFRVTEKYSHLPEQNIEQASVVFETK